MVPASLFTATDPAPAAATITTTTTTTTTAAAAAAAPAPFPSVCAWISCLYFPSPILIAFPSLSFYMTWFSVLGAGIA
jgi:hypothetical protein